MNKHVPEADLAVYAAGDSSWWAKPLTHLHVSRCAVCRGRADAYRADQERIRELAGELPPGAQLGSAGSGDTRQYSRGPGSGRVRGSARRQARHSRRVARGGGDGRVRGAADQRMVAQHAGRANSIARTGDEGDDALADLARSPIRRLRTSGRGHGGGNRIERKRKCAGHDAWRQ